MLKDSKTLTRKGDLKHDFAEPAARMVFNSAQAEEEGKDSIDAGGGSSEMIYMEYLEAWGAISEYKYPNPYIPLHVKIETMFSNDRGVFACQSEFALKKKKGSKKKKGKK